MRSSSLPDLPNCIVRIRCLILPTSSPSSLLLLKTSHSRSIMTTSSKVLSTNLSDISSIKPSTPQTTCNICKRLLYSFEEILICRICDGSYHWRCVKPDMISHYGENTHFVCDKCNDNITGTTSNSSQRQINGGVKVKSHNTSEADYRDFANLPSKLSTTSTKDTSVVSAIRYFEEKQQQQIPNKTSKLNETDDHLLLQTNGQFTDDGKTIRRIQQQQQQNLHNDDENTSIGMIQANYQYTPLKEYAAMRNGGRTINDINTTSYQNASSTNSDRQFSSQYNSSTRYTNHGFETPPSTHFTSPTIDNISIHNRQQQHFITTTNLNVNDKTPHHQQNEYKTSSTYVSPIHGNESITFKPTYQQTDRYSTVGSDSGIVMINPNPQQQQATDDNQIIEKKLTNLVQKIGRQLETDAQKLSDKLELKLKNLENMIHQQTYIIRQQDEVIERLKSKILKIETERDHFRERLSIHEQREQDDKKYLQEESNDHKALEQDDQQQTSYDVSGERKYSNSSSVITDNSRRSSKKTPAPRVDQQAPIINNEPNSTLGKLIKSIPCNSQERPVSGNSSPSIAAKLAAAVPLTEKPAAASRLDNIIHQNNSSGTYYNVGETHETDPKPNSIEHIVTKVHHNDEYSKSYQISEPKLQRSASLSSSSSSTVSMPNHTEIQYGLPTTNHVALTNRNSSLHRSLEVIPRKTSQNEQVLKPANKTASLEFGARPVRYDESTSIYVTPQEATHPASEYENVVKGWLRKQNRDSFFKRIERYYCVLSKNTLLLHKHDLDRTPHKAINLKGAKILYYEDPKYGPSLELTWSNRQNSAKHYHLYARDAQEAQQWVTGIQTAINNSDEKNKWQRYHLIT
ncbi:unnamed protein product [Adineta steineri]|uniref:Uncharacterized protein n=1 Tax=Adineta steineri TaxID=433720 RepID=A0A819LCG0_9BILA|nr:unnamed protein product [Adineta steineri]